MPTATLANDTTVTIPEQTPELRHVGIELEYPIGDGPLVERADTSDNLYRQVGSGAFWSAGGRMTHDHIGAEITSDVMDLHSDEPETWYRESIEHAEDLGYPFAGRGYAGSGSGRFGLHHHISNIEPDVARSLWEMSQEPWLQVFACGSITQNSADPWRQYGPVGRPGEPTPTTHHEWRLPEPVSPEHHALILDFLRMLSYEGLDAAANFAQDIVFSRDERLTAIRQYQHFRETRDNWPNATVISSGNRTNPETAKFMVRLMGDNPEDLE